MPAVYIDANGVEHYYFPPPPKTQPPKPSTPDVNTPHFHHLLEVAGQATTAYDNNPNSANTTAFNNDWSAVQEWITEQYRLALNSSDPSKQVAALNQQYGQVFGNSNGETSYVYHRYVLPGAQQEADKETSGERNAEIQFYNALDEPDSSQTKGYDVAQADITLHLQILYGDGKSGAYTPTQYQAAEAAADQDFDSTFAPVITEVGTSMQQGAGFSTLLKVLETEGRRLTPAQIAALGGLLTPQEARSGVLTLTPGQAQLAKIDPVTLALLMTAGINIPPLSPQMLQIAQNSPNTFFYLEANGINISVGKTPSSRPPAGVAVFNLGHGQQLNITINGKPITLAQLPPDPSETDGQNGSGTGRPSTGLTPSTVLGIYLSSETSTKGSGVVTPGSVAVANLLLGDPNLNLQVTPQALLKPTTARLGSLSFLVSQADSARPGYINTTLTSLLAAAPPPGSKGAAAYFTNVINPFLTTQTNGFFSSDDAVSFWKSSPVINMAGTAGGAPNSSLYTYLQSWLGTQFNNPNDPKLSDAAANISQALAGAPPGLAQMLIPMLEGKVNKLTLQMNDPRIVVLFDDFSEAVQIAAQFPALSTVADSPTSVAKWLNSLGQQFGSVTGPSTLTQDTELYGYTDLPNALAAIWNGSADAYAIQNGEQTYNSTLQGQLGKANYEAFQNNKTQVLKGFFGQFSNTPNIGKPIGVSNTAALRKAIIAAYGFTAQDMVPGSQDYNIVNIDLSWIHNQSDPGATVTILPFLFASASAEFGTETGVFFDIWNPPQKQTHQQGEGRFSSGKMVTTQTGPTHVLIDGSAAGDALQMDPNVWQHPEKSDVEWHYSSYRDFQLGNTDYQNGTIYTLPGNQLGIGSDGAASSATDFHKEFDAVMGDVVGASQVAGLVLAPFTGWASLAITGTLGLAWGTYQGIEGYDDATSHGERFSLSNPNTRWEAVSDITVAVGWATLGVAGTEASLTRDAADAAGTAETVTGEASTATTTVAAESSNTVKALGVTKKVLEYGNYGLAAVQTRQQIQSFAANYDNMSFWQRVNAAAAIFEGTFPFAAEPMNRMWFDGDWSRRGQQQERSDPFDPDDPSNTPARQTNTEAKGPTGSAPVVATESIFSPDVSENDSVAQIDAMTPAELRQHGSEAAFVLSYYNDLFMTSDPSVPSDPRFTDLADLMHTAFYGDRVDELDSLRARAEFLNEMIDALPEAVTEPDSNVQLAVVTTRAQADRAKERAASLRTELESQPSSGPTVAASRLQHTRDVVKHFLHIPYDEPWIGGKTVRVARDIWARTVGARHPHGEYRTPQQMRDNSETPPAPIEGGVFVESPQATLPISVDSRSKGSSLVAKVRKVVPTPGRGETLTVEKARRVSLATPLGQSTMYMTPSEFVAPEETGRGVESYFSIQFQNTAGSVDDVVRNPETMSVIDAGLKSARTSVDPNIRDAAEKFATAQAEAAAGGPQAPDGTDEFSEAEKRALRRWIATENDSRFTGSKSAGTRSSNAQNVIDRLFDDTTLPEHLIQGARDLSVTVWGSSEPVVFGDDVPQADVPLTLAQSRQLSRLVLAAWKLRDKPDNPLTASNNNTLTDLISSTKVSKDDWRTVQKFALGAATSPDADLAAAGENTLNALGNETRAGALRHAQLNAVVPLLSADRDSVSVAGSRIEPSAKDTLSLRGTLVKDLVEGGAWSSPRVWELARGYARYLKAFSPDPVVSKAAAVALKELPRFSVPERDAPIADSARQALNRLFEADEASPYRQWDPKFDNNFTYRPDRNLMERYLAVTQQHPSNILLSELSEDGIPKPYPSPGISYQVSFDLIESMNTRPEFGFAKPLDENDPTAGYGPHLVPSDDGKYYITGAPAYAKVIAQRTVRIALPWSPLDMVGIKVRLEFEMHSTKYLYNYLDASSGRVFPGYTTLPEGMPLTPHQAALFEVAFKYGKSPYTKEGRISDMMAGLSQSVPVWKAAFNREWWRSASLGKALPREEQSADTLRRRVLDRSDGVFVASVNLEIPHTGWVEHLIGVKLPRVGLLTFTVEGVRKFMKPHVSADRTSATGGDDV